MSLILDALRKADAERERGTIPGLHSQADAPHAAEVPARPARPPWPWLLAGVAVGLLAAGGWWLFGREGPRGAPMAVPGPATTPAALPDVPPPGVGDATPPAPPAATAATAAPAAPTAPSMQASLPPPPVDPVPPRLDEAAGPVAQPAPWKAPEPRKGRAPAAVAATDASASPVPQPAGAPASEPPLPTRDQLPDAVRGQLPTLAFGGSIYSANAANRSLIVNGRLVRENENLGGDLVLEQIRPKSAVLRFRGLRFEVHF